MRELRGCQVGECSYCAKCKLLPFLTLKVSWWSHFLCLDYQLWLKLLSFLILEMSCYWLNEASSRLSLRDAPRRKKEEESSFYLSLSRAIGVPPPLPWQTAANPKCPFFCCKVLSRVTKVRVPEAPRGSPSAIAPPKTFYFYSGVLNKWLNNTLLRAKASLFSNKSKWLIFIFSFSNSFFTARIGALGNLQTSPPVHIPPINLAIG